MGTRSRAVRLVACGALVAVLSIVGAGTARSSPMSTPSPGPGLPSTDLLALLSLTTSQLAAETPVITPPGPPLASVPRAQCASGYRPLSGMQGRVPGAAIRSATGLLGWTCNVSTVAHFRSPGGFRTWRYRDPAGHTCAYYDTSLAAPLTVVSPLAGPSLGVEVLDVSDVRRPVHTATLTSLAMLSPHESLNLNARRGLLVAEVGNAATLPGTLDVYSVRQDCRHPRLLGQAPIAMGHESGFSPDGRTFWVAGAAGYVYAFDIADPRHPHQIWRGAYYSHGLNLSSDGRTLYQTDPINGNIAIIDVSQIQDRVDHPRVREIRRLSWPTVSIPQNSQPFTSHGRRYLLEFDEFAFRFNPATLADRPGGARIIDITTPSRPRVVSDLRLAVQVPANHRIADVDPMPLGYTKALGYGAHYCALPTSVSPTIAVCSELNSGLRVFDIADPLRPREVGYFVAPPRSRSLLSGLPGDLAFSKPAFDVGRHDVYYTDAVSGLYVVHLNRRAWP